MASPFSVSSGTGNFIKGAWIINMGMRQQFTKTMQYLSDNDERCITLLNDIGVFAFRHLKEKYPDRVYNLGILEPASISICAGLSLTGFIPFFHTIAPFIVERGYEQLKDDFGYQNINGNFISVGASYDYSGLGMTHYCPGDVGALMQIPNMQIIVPGTEEEFDSLLRSEYDNGRPTYFRLADVSNTESRNVIFSSAEIIKKGKKGTVVAVGNMLDRVAAAAEGLDVTVLYYTTLKPFDGVTLRENTCTRKILLCEPYYYGVLAGEVIHAFSGEPVRLEFAGIPHQILDSYGTADEMDQNLGMTKDAIQEKLTKMVQEGE